MTSLGPVSQELEQQVREKVQRNRLVIWLDPADHYTEFVDELIRDHESLALNYTVKAYRGSYLELLMQLEQHTAGVEKPTLLIHLPNFNKTTVTDTPLLELYKAGMTYECALPTIIKNAAATHIPSSQIDAFLSQENPSVASADLWLSTAIEDDGSGLTGRLRHLNLTELIVDLTSKNKPGAISQQLKNCFKREEQATIVDQIVSRLVNLTGADDDWLRQHLEVGRVRGFDLGSNAVSWALCVEYVNDLVRPPYQEELQPITSLPDAVQTECCRLADYLRRNEAKFYESIARDTQEWLEVERDKAKADDLGKIDTFPFEEEKILKAAIIALSNSQWDRSLEWAQQRTDEQSFWLGLDRRRSEAWKLVAQAATLGRAIQVAGKSLGDIDNLETALERYTSLGSNVDLAHRQLEQLMTRHLVPGVPEFEDLRTALQGLREDWRTWADQWAVDFNQLCVRSGFLPPQSLRQRRLFDEVVRPIATDNEVTALFLIDGMRYEMAKELYAELSGTPATQMKLDARFAELPSVTEVGMNVLAPVDSENNLVPHLGKGRILGFSTGEFRVYDPKTRKRAMKNRVGGTDCPWLTLKEVRERSADSLKTSFRRAKLLVVESKEIDTAGHEGVGPSVFPNTLRHIKAAWRLLRDAGVQNFVITSDHGFLLLPDIDQPVQARGRAIDPKGGRHTITTVFDNNPDEVAVSLRALEYDCDDLHVVFPLTTKPFDRGNTGCSFVHGGNSFQERVIPVMTISHSAKVGRLPKFDVVVKAGSPVMSSFRLHAQVIPDRESLGLDYASGDSVELVLQAMELEDAEAIVKDVAGGAKWERGSIVAEVGKDFEVFFELTGSTDGRVPVQLLHTAGEADVEPGVVSERFTVSVVPTGTPPPVTDEPEDEQETAKEKPVGSGDGAGWLQNLPGDDVRSVFLHLEQHGVITGEEVDSKLGGVRAGRRFSRKFEEFARLAPFEIRIDSIDGMKRYVKEGGA